MKDSIWDGFAVGVFGTAVLGTLLNLLPGSYRSMAADAIAECQKSLPRDQTCVVVAVPKDVSVIAKPKEIVVDGVRYREVGK